MDNVSIIVYGAKQICASCVGAPSSKDTYEWLKAAIGRKYIDDNITYEYIDIEAPPTIEKHQQFVEKIITEDLFYPIVMINDEVVAEGTPSLKPIYHALNKYKIAVRPT